LQPLFRSLVSLMNFANGGFKYSPEVVWGGGALNVKVMGCKSVGHW
jgi:hypothetical protein